MSSLESKMEKKVLPIMHLKLKYTPKLCLVAASPTYLPKKVLKDDIFMVNKKI